MIRPGRIPMAVARWLLHSFPSRTRKTFGDDLLQFIRDDFEAEVGSGRTSRFRFWARTFGGLVTNGFGERMSGSGEPPSGSEPEAGRKSGPPTYLADGGREAARSMRGLFKTPGFTLTTLATLALGIGAVTIIFSVISPILLAPLPYPDPDRLVILRERPDEPEGVGGWVSPLTFRDWREQAESFEDIVSYRLSLLTWTDGETPELLRGWAVSAGFFSVMGVDMTLGRGFVPEEDVPGQETAVVLSHGFWTRAFGADPTVLGRTMNLDGRAHTVVGVAGPEIDYPSSGDYWHPIAFDYAREFRDFRYLGVLGRIRSDQGVEVAQAEMDRLSASIAEASPDTNTDWGAEVVSLREVEVGGIRPTLTAMAAAVALLLIIALGNVANLTLARAAGKRTDVAVRKAMGAGTPVLVRLSVVESLILAWVGSALGLLLAELGIRGLTASGLLSLPRVTDLSVGFRGTLFAVGAATVVGLTLGMVASMVQRGGGLAELLRSGGAGGMAPSRSHRIREVVLATQVAMALALLVGATVLTRSLVTLSRVDAGFEPTNLMTFGYDLPSAGYPDPDATRAFESAAAERLQNIPGVEAAGLVTPIPLEMGSVPSTWTLSSDVRDPSDGPIMAHMRTVSPEYFEAMGVSLATGRLFQAVDDQNAPGVAIVNRTFIDRYLDGAAPLGFRISAGDPGDQTAEWAEVVGVVESVKFRSLRVPADPEIYLPLAQLPTGWGHIVVRSSLPRETLVAQVKAGIQELDPNMPLADVRSGTEIISRQLRTSRLSTLLTALFAIASTALAAVGILGVLSLMVAQRMRELGLRKVLGADAGSLWRFVFQRGLRPVVWGLVLGTGLAVAGTRLLQSQLYQVSALDPLAFILPPVGLLVVGILACVAPGLRANATDPVVLLKSE